MGSKFGSQLFVALICNVVLRAFTFIFSTYLTRLLLPGQVGVGFTFEVYKESLHFLARECFRNVAARYSVLSHETHGDTHSSIHPEKLASLLNVAALTVPSTVAITFGLELLALVILPSAGSVLRSLYALVVGTAAKDGRVPSWVSSVGSVSLSSIVPSLSNRLVADWASVWGIFQGEKTIEWNAFPWDSSLWVHGLMGLYYALPELLMWATLVITSLADPAVLLLTSLDCFRAVVMCEAIAHGVRLILTIFLVKFALPSSSIRFFNAASTSGAAIQFLEPYNEEWKLRLVYAVGFFIEAVAIVAVYVIACGNGAEWCRRLLGTSKWKLQAPSQAQPKPAKTTTSKGARDTSSCNSASSFVPLSQRVVVGLRNVCFPLSSHIRWVKMKEVALQHQSLLLTFFRESIIQLVLAEGTNFALITLADAGSRGCYQTINRLGTIVARMVFRIWDNAYQSHWAQLIAANRKDEAVEGLAFMLRLSFYAGYAASLLGPLYARFLLSILYAGRWTTGGLILSFEYFIHSVGIMGWNGLLQSFLRAAAHPPLLKRQQNSLVVISGVYVLSSYSALGYLRHRSEAGEGSGEGCHNTSVVMTLLMLHRYSLVASVVLNLALLLFSRNTSGSPNKGLQTASKPQINADPKSEASSNGSAANISSEYALQWRDLRMVFHIPTLCVLGCLFIWTRTRSLFPDIFTTKLYMLPVLPCLLAGLVLSFDAEMRREVFRVVHRFVKPASKAKEKLQ